MQTDIGPAIARVTARESREFRVLLSTPALTKGRDEKKKREIRELRRLIQRETIKESLGGIRMVARSNGHFNHCDC